MAQRKKMGRPKKKGPLRNKVLPLRLTEAEHRLVDRAARAADLPRGIYARMALLQKARKDTKKGGS